VAHDFNNILTTIVGAAHLATLDAEPDSDLAKEIEQIDIAARRAQSLVQELLTFARREPGKSQPVDLSDIVDEVTNLLKASVPPTVTLEVEAAPGNLTVLGDPTHLHQVVMNLCRNAAEAMSGTPGTIRVGLAHHDTLEDCEPCGDGWVRLSVMDDGPGMSADTKAHLFEPFFTTKPLGKGSGLGLSVVFGLVEEMSGRIRVDSTPGQGSCFRVDIPATTEAAREQVAKTEPIPGGHDYIMVIDDEAEIAGTFRRVLMRLGYRVEAFTSPLVALERFRVKPDRYDLVISDIVMPDMSGEELITRFLDLRPDLPVIYCSAYSPATHKSIEGGPMILRKPVDPAQLARGIRNLLDA
jgi:CheY-like chemotaxis protein